MLYGLVSLDCEVYDRISIVCLSPPSTKFRFPLPLAVDKQHFGRQREKQSHKVKFLWYGVSIRVGGRDTRSWVGLPVKSRVFTGPWLGRCVA